MYKHITSLNIKRQVGVGGRVGGANHHYFQPVAELQGHVLHIKLQNYLVSTFLKKLLRDSSYIPV